jgi:miniconductance mechanosensitive channel
MTLAKLALHFASSSKRAAFACERNVEARGARARANRERETVQLYRWVERNLLHWGIPHESSDILTALVILVAVLLLALVGQRLSRRFISTSVAAISRRTEARWDDMLAKRRIFEPLSHLTAGIVFFTLLPIAFVEVQDSKDAIRRGSLVYMVIITALVVDRLLTALVDLYQELDVSRNRPPIKSYAQLLKILNYLVTGILLISITMGQSPAVLLGGLGALSAVLLLVFRDPLLGLVASVQLSANDMVRKGDPVEVPKYGIEGEVIDMSLTMIKVQGPDKSVAMLPNYALVNDSFRNLRGIREAGVRRIKRALYFDLHSIRFSGQRKLGDLSNHADVRRVLPDLVTRFKPGAVTNLGVFRAYMEARAGAHARLATHLPLFARQLAPSERGLGVELTCYLEELDYAAFEGMQADLFEHFIAMAPVFELRLFQNPGANPDASAPSVDA